MIVLAIVLGVLIIGLLFLIAFMSATKNCDIRELKYFKERNLIEID